MDILYIAIFLLVFVCYIIIVKLRRKTQHKTIHERKQINDDMNDTTQYEIATFGGGCFWCTEAVFKEIIGVKSVVSGYAGGKTTSPTYEQVCSGKTGHAECIQITFDPSKVAFDTLLNIFMKTHDPTTPNRQGNDIGTQYRSVVFYMNEDQKLLSENYIAKLNAAHVFDADIVTEVSPLSIFYKAENYHQDYFFKNPYQGYCQAIVAKKVNKFESLFPEIVKPEYKK